MEKVNKKGMSVVCKYVCMTVRCVQHWTVNAQINELIVSNQHSLSKFGCYPNSIWFSNKKKS